MTIAEWSDWVVQEWGVWISDGEPVICCAFLWLVSALLFSSGLCSSVLFDISSLVFDVSSLTLLHLTSHIFGGEKRPSSDRLQSIHYQRGCTTYCSLAVCQTLAIHFLSAGVDYWLTLCFVLFVSSVLPCPFLDSRLHLHHNTIQHTIQHTHRVNTIYLSTFVHHGLVLLQMHPEKWFLHQSLHLQMVRTRALSWWLRACSAF